MIYTKGNEFEEMKKVIQKHTSFLEVIGILVITEGNAHSVAKIILQRTKFSKTKGVYTTSFCIVV